MLLAIVLLDCLFSSIMMQYRINDSNSSRGIEFFDGGICQELNSSTITVTSNEQMSLLLLVTVHKSSLFGGLDSLPLWEKAGLLCEGGSLTLAGVEGGLPVLPLVCSLATISQRCNAQAQ